MRSTIPLTDLPNRALFSDRLDRALASAKRDSQRLAIIFMDLDDFKPISDSLGHGVGDQLLQQIWPCTLPAACGVEYRGAGGR